jgi:cytosine/adenosine deaminase-related metal-dependent hydrolase
VTTFVLNRCIVVTVNAQRDEYAAGHVITDGRRITAVGPGPAPADLPGARYIDAAGCLATPGLINTHHHLYQWATRGMAVDSTLFGWLTTLYPVWAGLDEAITHATALAGLSWLARTGCSTTTDHHYVFPRGGGDLLAATIEAARTVGLRFHPNRGSMDLGRSAGGLPPDEVVEDRDQILAATEAAIDRYHDSSPVSMLRIAVGPCSPFSVTGELLKDAVALARSKQAPGKQAPCEQGPGQQGPGSQAPGAQVRLHTHLAETADEDDYCAEHFGCSPVEYLDSLGWLGSDVWLAHAIHLDDQAIGRLAATGTGVAHCPSSNARLGAGICRSRDLLAAGVPVGLGVDGPASNEASSLLGEVRAATLVARAVGGPQALGVRQALEMATMGGARVLGREAEIGSLEPGKLADVALWRLDSLPHAGIADPVAALVLGSAAPLELLLVNGRPVVERDHVLTVDEQQVAAGARAASKALLRKAGVTS